MRPFRMLGRMIPEDLVPADCPWQIVLGIDPGTRVAGYGALVVAPEGPRLVCCGIVRTPSRAKAPERLAVLAQELETLLERLRPDVLAVEGAFSARNARSALRLGEARGVVLAGGARRGIQVVEIPPAVAKKAVAGHGAASKEQVAATLASQLSGLGPDVPADATDALAIAMAHVRRMDLERILGRGSA